MKNGCDTSFYLNNSKSLNLFKYIVLIFFFLFVGFVSGSEKVEGAADPCGGDVIKIGSTSYSTLDSALSSFEDNVNGIHAFSPLCVYVLHSYSTTK